MSEGYLLVVDDSDTQRKLVQHTLEQDGYRIRTASGGRQALQIIDEDLPELVVCDLRMPDMDGMQVVETLRGTHPSLPVILTTSEGSEDIAAEALRRGAASYVPKREISTTLTMVVRQVMSLGEASRSVRAFAPYTIESRIQIAFPSDESLVPQAIARLDMVLNNTNTFDDGARMQIGMALDEALMNSVVHGNLEVESSLREEGEGEAYFKLIEDRKEQSPYCDRKVHVELSVTPKRAKFVIRDEGPGFNCDEVSDPTTEDNLEAIGGRGMFMINALMDEVHYNQCGNEITMIKHVEEDAEA
ncbi:MAG: response regulator [Planctomycetota bacterium]